MACNRVGSSSERIFPFSSVQALRIKSISATSSITRVFLREHGLQERRKRKQRLKIERVKNSSSVKGRRRGSYLRAPFKLPKADQSTSSVVFVTQSPLDTLIWSLIALFVILSFYFQSLPAFLSLATHDFDSLAKLRISMRDSQRRTVRLQ